MKPIEKPRYFKNHDRLCDHGNTALRKLAVDILDHGIRAADPYLAAKRLVSLDGDRLQVGELHFNLQDFERVFVFGAGKATHPIAIALEEILGERISGGLVVLKRGDTADLKHIQVIYGAHPVPDEEGHRGAKLMYKLAGECTQKDLVLVAMTGGSSALLPLPVEGVSLEDKKQVNQTLLFSGADITHINAVRKHISRLKGGWLAQRILPATLINLTVSDVNGDPLDYITGPTVPDTATFDDARRAMDTFELWDKFPHSAADYLRRGGSEQETPKSFEGQPLHTFILVESAAACEGAAARAKELELETMLLTSTMQGEASQAGAFLSSIGQEIAAFNRPLSAPCAVIAGGENTVTIQDEHGAGGANQEFALGAGLKIAGLENVLIASIDTDGTDGPTELAGAMVDGHTVRLAAETGLDLTQALNTHDALPALESLGDGILTGPTGTNVNDIKLLLVM
jgi:glycerate 2-kinase